MFRRADELSAQGPERDGEPAEGELVLPSPHLPGDLDALLTTRPCFRGALRGYDRLQVDNYVAWAESELGTLRRRTDHLLAGFGAAHAELETSRRLLAQSPRGREFTLASDRVAEMLELAADEAAALTTAGAEEADRMLAEARLEADARLRKAQDIKQAAMAAGTEIRELARRERAEAAGLLDRAREQAQHLLRAAAAERDRLGREAAEAQARLVAVEGEIEGLRRQRDEARQLLRRLTDQIGRALDAIGDVAPTKERIVFDGNVAQLT